MNKSSIVSKEAKEALIKVTLEQKERQKYYWPCINKNICPKCGTKSIQRAKSSKGHGFLDRMCGIYTELITCYHCDLSDSQIIVPYP